MNLTGRDPHFSFRDRMISQPDIGGYIAGEENDILEDNAEIGTELKQIYLPDIYAVEQNLALLDFIESQQKVGDGCFACSCKADEGDLLTRFYNERDILQYPIVSLVGEPDIAELDAAAGAAQLYRFLHGRIRDWLIQKTEDSLR